MLLRYQMNIIHRRVQGHDGVLTTTSQTFPFEFKKKGVASEFDYKILSQIYQNILDLTNNIDVEKNKERIIKRGRFNYTILDFCHDFRVECGLG